MNAKTIRSVAIATAGLLTFSSCTTTPSYGYGGGGYGGGGQYGGQPQIDPVKTGALVAAGVAGLSLYHYNRKKQDLKKERRKHDYHHASSYGNQGGYYGNQRGYRDQRNYRGW